MFKRFKNSLSRKIMLGFIGTILVLGLIIFSCCQYYNINNAKENYKKLADSCAKTAATTLFNMPVEKYFKSGKNELYNEQLASMNSICKNFGLKYLYVYVPNFKKNTVTTVFYVDGTKNENVKNRDLGTMVTWQLTQQEKDVFAGKENINMYENDNYMGHTISSYAVIRNIKNEPIALAAADLDFDKVMHSIVLNIVNIVVFIILCLLMIYFALITYLNSVVIKPIIDISKKMQNFHSEDNIEFTPIKIKSEDEFGLMATAFNKMVSDIKSYIKRISDTQMETIFSLAKLAQSRDDETGKHLERVQQYCYLLAVKLGQDSPYSELIDETFIENIVSASVLHDIGKVGIPDAILLCKGRPNDDDFEILKKHTLIGYDTLNEVHSKFGSNSFIEMGMVISLYHHERWDGSGYPTGIKGEKIPLPARVMALADVYDALRSKRVYKPALSHEECIEIIKNDSGTKFDPVVVDAFLEIADDFYRVSCTFNDM